VGAMYDWIVLLELWDLCDTPERLAQLSRNRSCYKLITTHPNESAVP
jgi:hypothetical protein